MGFAMSNLVKWSGPAGLIVAMLSLLVAILSLLVNFGRYQADWAKPTLFVSGHTAFDAELPMMELDVQNIGWATATEVAIGLKDFDRKWIQNIMVEPTVDTKLSSSVKSVATFIKFDSLGREEDLNIKIFIQPKHLDALVEATVTCAEGVRHKTFLPRKANFEGKRFVFAKRD